jgi:hypothetical protein
VNIVKAIQYAGKKMREPAAEAAPTA